MTVPKKVIIESPFAGQSTWVGISWVACTIDKWKNVQYARICLLDSLQRDEAPLASHLLYPQVLDDATMSERAQGIAAGLIWGREAELVAVYVDRGVSAGMRKGIREAETQNIPIEYRKLTT